MPQATPALRKKFPGWDAQALKVISKNFDVDRGGLIHPKAKGYQMTERESDAIDYLFQEWDYDYTHEPINARPVQKS